jgi:hypothetical protein
MEARALLSGLAATARSETVHSAVAEVDARSLQIAPSSFQVRILAGPDKGLTLNGTLALQFIGHGHQVRGMYQTQQNGALPVSGRLGAGKVQLQVDLGPGKTVRGSGIYEPVSSGPHVLGIVATGYLRGPAPGDIGDWADAPNGWL